MRPSAPGPTPRADDPRDGEGVQSSRAGSGTSRDLQSMLRWRAVRATGRAAVRTFATRIGANTGPALAHGHGRPLRTNGHRATTLCDDRARCSSSTALSGGVPVAERPVRDERWGE
ncbi:hypothetical protein FTX61_04630 [Nitriliruptoraceae bacterium ZYF776]|nr:hypothetical protein [Profundirhabdus halotolerans]